jgi:hypothetical protein
MRQYYLRKNFFHRIVLLLVNLQNYSLLYVIYGNAFNITFYAIFFDY